MRTTVKSPGTRLVSALHYRSVPEAVDWLCAAFAFEKHRVVTGDDGDLLYAHLTFGDHMVMVLPVRASDLASFIKQPYEVGGAETQSCYIVVNDADAHYRTARAAGASIVLDLNDDERGGRGYACRDPEGHIWSFGTYDPWQGHSNIDEPRASRGVITAALLVCVAAAAGTAGWMLPRPPRTEMDAAQLRQEAMTAQQSAETGAKRAGLLAAELAQERSAKDAAERAAREAREQLAQEQGAKRTAETSARQLEERLGEVLRASDAAEQKAKEARDQIAAERTVREAAQRTVSDATKELARERDAKQRAERSAQDALEQLARGQRAREDAERVAKEARDQLAQSVAERAGAKPQIGSTKEPEQNP